MFEIKRWPTVLAGPRSVITGTPYDGKVGSVREALPRFFFYALKPLPMTSDVRTLLAAGEHSGY